MNYELSVKGQRMNALRSAKSLLDCHLLRQQYSRSLKKTPVKKIQNFEFTQLSQTQTQLSTNRSKRTIQSQQRSKRERKFNIDIFQFSDSCQSSMVRLNSPPPLKVPNLQFNLNYHLKQLKFKEPPQQSYWQDTSQSHSPRVFVNRVYKVKKNNPKQQFFIECSKNQQD